MTASPRKAAATSSKGTSQKTVRVKKHPVGGKPEERKQVRDPKPEERTQIRDPRPEERTPIRSDYGAGTLLTKNSDQPSKSAALLAQREAERRSAWK